MELEITIKGGDANGGGGGYVTIANPVTGKIWHFTAGGGDGTGNPGARGTSGGSGTEACDNDSDLTWPGHRAFPPQGAGGGEATWGSAEK